MLWENNIVGQTIRSVRKAKGMSQEVLSGFAGIARTHLTMIECGTKQANFSTICKIAEAFDMRPSELVRKWKKRKKSGINRPAEKIFLLKSKKIGLYTGLLYKTERNRNYFLNSLVDICKEKR